MSKLFRVISLVLVCALIISLGLTGCGSKKDSTQSTQSTSKVEQSTASDASTATDQNVKWDKNKKDKIVMSFITGYYSAGQQRLAKEYMALHPETEVVVDLVADNDTYVQKLRAAFSTDQETAPDILQANFLQVGMPQAMAQGWMLDLTPILDEPNPYNDNKKVSEAFNAQDVSLMASKCGGKPGFLPFDWVGDAFYYNIDLFNKVGAKVPTTYEELLDVAEKFKSAGYANPIGASTMGNFVQGIYADYAYQHLTADFLALPGDAIYDENTMSANKQIKFDPNNQKFDEYAVFNDEKVNAYLKKNGYNTSLNKLANEAFLGIAKYFQKNWTNPDDEKIGTEFIMQKIPMIFHGSWMAGKFNADISKLSDDKKFKWGTFQPPSFANTPSEFMGAKVRGLWVPGSVMSITPKTDKDHMARVLDLYKYYFSPGNAQMIYEETLSKSQFIQGPPAIKGVTLSDDINAMLDGFVVEGNMRQEWGAFVGQSHYLQADRPEFDGNLNKFTDGSINYEQFIKVLNKLAMKRVDDQIKRMGYDLDPKTKDTAQK